MSSRPNSYSKFLKQFNNMESLILLISLFFLLLDIFLTLSVLFPSYLKNSSRYYDSSLNDFKWFLRVSFSFKFPVCINDYCREFTDRYLCSFRYALYTAFGSSKLTFLAEAIPLSSMTFILNSSVPSFSSLSSFFIVKLI